MDLNKDLYELEDHELMILEIQNEARRLLADDGKDPFKVDDVR